MICPFCSAKDDQRTKNVLIADGHITLCGVCGGYYLDPPFEVEYEESAWSSMREKGWERDVNRGRRKIPPMMHWFESLVGRPLESVLEVGCGSAYMGPGFISAGVAYTGIDVDSISVDLARSKGLDVHKVPAEQVRSTEIGTRTYDLVLSSNALEHVATPLEAFHSVRQCTGELAVIIVPNPEGLMPRAKSNPLVRKMVQTFLGNKREIAYTIDGYWHNIAYSKQTLQQLASASGLNVRTLRSIAINDDVFGFVQPNSSLAYRMIEALAGIFDMHTQLILVAD